MEYPSSGEGPAMLQLHRWSPSHFQFNLSEFREAFISPTRELLLLLSYQCEALLLPLTTGNSLNSEHPETCNYESPQDPYSSALSVSVPSRSDSRENRPCTSGSETMISDNDFVCESKFSKCSSHSYVCDVNSLAWGLCGDDYDQHKDTFFRELLFVSGNHGVTVHAFCHNEKVREISESALEDEFAQGMWVEWGPAYTSVHHGEVQRDDRCCSDFLGVVLDVNRSNGTMGNSNFCGKDGDDESARNLTPKKWLRSFLTKVETVKSEGNIWTRFPEKYPCSAKVVSFSIFDQGSSLFNLLSQMNWMSNGNQDHEEAALNLMNDVSTRTESGFSNLENDVFSSSLSVNLNSSYKCAKVFSNSSHDLIGFVLMVMDSAPEKIGDTSESRWGKFLIPIARLDGWGMQWISMVKLDEDLNMCSQVGWMDFQFSDNFLACLNASGLIFFYSVITGNYVAHLDVINTCGFGPQPSLQEIEKMGMESDLGVRNADFKIKQVVGANEKSTHQTNFGKRMFRKLVVATHASLLAVVDEYGVIYVIQANVCLPDKYHSFEKLVPHFQHLGLGMLAGWEIGGSEIGHQHAFSRTHNSGTTKSNELQEVWDKNLQYKGVQYDLHLSGFSAASKMVEERFGSSKILSLPMRKILLPTNKFSDDDLFCFSPLGITRLCKKRNSNGKESFQILHSCLHLDAVVTDDGCFNSRCENLNVQGREEVSEGEAVGCTFQGCFYLVTQGGLSVVLPSISVSPNFFPIEAIGYRQPNISTGIINQVDNIVLMEESKQPWPPWKVEVLDRVLLYEGPDEADCLCLENGWDLKMSRMRRLQLGLDYLKFDDIEQSLEMLVSVNLAEEGILRLIFAAVYLMSHKVANDNEISAASRLLALGTCFATKMIRKYGLTQHRKGACELLDASESQMYSLSVGLPNKEQIEMENSRKLHEMAHFLEIIRNLQRRLSAKFKKPGQVLADGGDTLTAMDADLLQDDAQLSILSADAVLLDTLNQHELSFPVSELGFNDTEKLALMPMESLDSKNYLDSRNFNELSALVPQGGVLEKAVLPMENPKDMIARWEIDNLDLKTVVKDALLSGRLPLAVLQLHLHHLRDLVNNKEPHDTFAEVRDIGRAIAYDLFLKGEIRLAVATLQKLGEDIETVLKELVFGTIRRSLRVQIAEEMKRYGYLGPYELKILERISLIERLYPSSSFWRTVLGRRKEFMRGSTNPDSPGGNNLRILPSHIFNNLMIECGEIDGVVLGSWETVTESTAVPVPDDVDAHAGYWAAAAVWSNAWDQTTIDRIVLDQHFLMGVHVLWESELEYYICRNDWVEVSKLLDMIPSSFLLYGSLQISMDSLQSAPTVGCNQDFPDYGNYICSIEELDTMSVDVPGIKIFRCAANNMCSIWLRMFMEQKLAKQFIFLKDYWEGTDEIIPLLAHSNFITSRNKTPPQDKSIESSSDLNISEIDGPSHAETIQALHKLVLHHCVEYNLPNLLDIYLDHHKLALDNESLSLLQEAAGDCHWAKWLLLSRIKGREYDASFLNARSIMSRNSVPSNNLNILGIEEIIRIVDDIAEGGGEMAALATLMFAPVPIQNCLSSGSVNRHYSSSAQCTLENLRPTLQRFPTLWRTLVAASFGHDATSNFLSPKAKNVFGNSSLSDYLSWRENLFFSTGHDTSLLQMLPCWFSKAIRRLIQLYVQGPLGWQSLESFLPRDVDPFVNSNDHADVSAISWEAAIQKHIEEELYASSLRETGIGLKQHLHRGRALAALNHLLGLRVQQVKLEKTKGQSSVSVNGQTNVQSDVQMLLAPITQSEESLLSSVTPLAIIHFEDSVLVASCAFLLELCGLSACMLRIDIAALRRISSFYKSSEHTEHYRQLSPKGSALHAVSHEIDVTNSLARALADHYTCHDCPSILKQKVNELSSKRPSRALMLVLQHLEKVSLPQMADGRTCGSWLLSGYGDGAELRSRQKAASQHWNLVTVFCQMHQIPLSTKYLGFLARDNDWVGFLSEAQVGGYTFETVIQVAAREFSDPRLKIHIVTVLKGLLSRKKGSSSSISDNFEKRNETSFADESSFIPVELFGILAECEKGKNPGEGLLVKAKELCWSILAMVASCFPDVSPLSCLTVWLEITAARETSSIKVNDIASKIANSVGAAVEATNSLPVGGRPLQFHYNRKNPKRRRLVEPIPLEPLAATMSDVSRVSDSAKIFSVEGFVAEEGRKSDASELTKASVDSDDGPNSLSKMVAVLCEQHLFLPLLRAFEMFLPSCSLLPFIRALQAFSQMRLSEASAHLGSFSARIKEEPMIGREGQIGITWISSTAVKSADAMLSTCPSPYEKRCLLQLLAATDFGDGGSAATYYRRLYWKINFAEPSLRKDDGLHLGNETLDDSSLLTALEKNGHWEQARNWARQLEASGGLWKSAVHHVTETQAESMVAEWKEFLWDVPEERVALWNHCQTLFLRYSFPALQAGLFFLKHAEAVEKDLPTRELHELLLLSLQWLSGLITLSNPVYPLHLLREIETRVWLLAVESEAQVKSEGGDLIFTSSSRDPIIGRSSNIVDRTASIVAKMDNHINMRIRSVEKNDMKENNQTYYKNSLVVDANFATTAGGNTKSKRRAKGYILPRRQVMDTLDRGTDPEDGSSLLDSRNDLQLQDENFKLEVSFSRWAERVGPGELERAVLSLLEFGQITAAKQLQHKLSPGHMPSEFVLVDAALKLASLSTPSCEGPISMLDEDLRAVFQSYKILPDHHMVNPLKVLESLATIFAEGHGRGLCKRIIAIVKAANVLGLSFLEAFNKQPIEVLQLLSLKAQDSLVEANLLVQTHSMPAGSIAQILAESFLKGLLAAHRGGYMDSQKEEGPSPLLWRFSDFLEWAELCPSEPEIGHALMRIVITGQEIPHACEVELLILSHHFYRSSACLDGVDVLVSLAATRVEAYVSEGDFACLARLITGVGNFHALNFILGILIENGQLDLLLQKYSAAADTNTGTGEADRGFQMAVLTSLKQFNPSDLDAFAMVYNHFNMKHETAALLESRAEQSFKQWFLRNDKDQNEDLLESMRYFIEAAEVHSSVDAGNTTRRACAQASLVSLQIRMPDFQWLNLSETNARRALVEQSRFQEALIVAEGYNLNSPSEWALVLWNQMLKPELTEQFVAEFVAVLPLQPSMLTDLARFYRAEVAARGDQSQFSVWLTGGGLPAEWLKYLGRSFRCLLSRTRDLRLRLQLATVATGFGDVIDACNKELDKVPDTAGPLVLRKGHGGAYLPLM